MSIIAQNKKLKELFQNEKFEECADFASQLLQNNPKEKTALMFFAQCQLKLGALQECQDTLNDLYSCCNTAKDANILLPAYKCNENLARRWQE